MRREFKKLTLFTTIFVLAINYSYCQEQAIVVSLSSGPAFTNASQKNYQQGNGYGLHTDVFVPFYRKGWDGSVKGSSFTLGINAGIDYTALKNLQPGSEVIGGKYLVNNGITNISNNSFKKYSGSFSGTAGLQAQFAFGKFVISPIISAGYISVKQEGHTQTGNFSINGQPFVKDLAKQDAVKESGFLIKPQLRLGYTVSDRVQLYLGSAFIAGPQMEYTLYTLIPQGGFKENNMYEADQIKNGTYKETRSKSRYKTSEIHLGISIGLGKSTRNQLHNASSGMETINSLAMALPGSPIGGIVVKGGKNPGGNSINVTTDENGEVVFPVTEPGEYTLQLTTSETQGKSINEKGVKRSESARPGSPIGGIVVKGGKNPGGNMISVISNNDGEFELNGLEAGNYQFNLVVPDGEKGISEEGVKRSESARPGSPIGGIVVKGGKNPGGNMTNLTVDKNGTIQFEVLEAGDYKFIIQTPENLSPGKQKKVKEKATSGLKDNIKTNV